MTTSRSDCAPSSPRWLQAAEAILQYDFCPWANRWVYWLKNPLWCLGLATAVSAACGFLVNPQVFLVTAALALLFIAGTLWPWLCIRGINCSLQFDKQRVREGELVTVKVTLTNRWPWPVWGLRLVRGFEGDERSPVGAAFARVAGWSRADFSWEFRPGKRGIYPLTPPEIETGFPFGLCRTRTSAESANSLIVWPQTVSLNSVPDAEDRRTSDERYSARRVGDFGDMAGVRRFRDGDSLRSVHWVQTARQREIIVCERQAPTSAAVRVIVDVDSIASLDVDRQATWETMIRVAASICESLHRQHAEVECVVGETRLVCGHASAEFRRMMDGFAQLHLPEPSHRTSTRRSAKTGRSDLLEIVVTAASTAPDGATTVRRRNVLIGESNHLPAGAGHVCPWLLVPANSQWSQQLKQNWRRVCHAA